jgi:hypothetical protein
LHTQRQSKKGFPFLSLLQTATALAGCSVPRWRGQGVVVFIKTFLSFAENTTTSVSTYGGATSASGGQNSPQAAAYPPLAGAGGGCIHKNLPFVRVNTTTSVSTYGGATSASGGQNSPQAAAYPLLAEVVAVSATRADSSTFEKLTKLTNT